jgi:5'(3')-deoxyribonucleotidase
VAKKIQNVMRLYIDMDNVLVDFKSAFDWVTPEQLTAADNDYADVPGIFAQMQPMAGAIEAVVELAKVYDLYLLSTAPWKNPSAWSDKVKWVQKYWGADKSSPVYKKLILTHHKDLNQGAFLVDDRKANGADGFDGVHLHFGQKAFPNWQVTKEFLLQMADRNEE